MFEILMCIVREGVLLQMTLIGHDLNLDIILHSDSHLMEEITAGKLLTHMLWPKPSRSGTLHGQQR
jgi:hypothetical protein